ncbi:hypothetical protein GOP47_0009220 [Adiantum capillus-veneris]|uniref:Uncharacterized protein n=1 Tax=Adiantum capillus-veneris TaxID=13818 RepID=A0A9D4ZH10_ADICA|nr:hypothetical protein GOP47_0009220 [Adiantum capillus-veneris]
MADAVGCDIDPSMLRVEMVLFSATPQSFEQVDTPIGGCAGALIELFWVDSAEPERVLLLSELFGSHLLETIVLCLGSRAPCMLFGAVGFEVHAGDLR